MGAKTPARYSEDRQCKRTQVIIMVVSLIEKEFFKWSVLFVSVVGRLLTVDPAARGPRLG